MRGWMFSVPNSPRCAAPGQRGSGSDPGQLAVSADERRQTPEEATAAGESVLAEQLASLQQIVRIGRQRTATA